jgi:hypothetical protein
VKHHHRHNSSDANESPDHSIHIGTRCNQLPGDLFVSGVFVAKGNHKQRNNVPAAQDVGSEE